MQPKQLRAALLEWYARAARDLPWRRTRDPYAIWVSEIMLQQTRVQTVVRYYDRFLARFPTPQALANASSDEVMAAWSGLGYYRRARLLHDGVREVVARYGGKVPEEASERRALPGIGRYTAGAIGSIAFDREEPVVDGNVARVLCRLLALETPVSAPATQARLWQAAEQLVAGRRPGALNQALMELGATLCTKHAPRCARCPLQGACRAHTEGRAQELPIVPKKEPPREVALVSLVATSGRGARPAIWLCKQEGTLFSGLWNLPTAEGRGRAVARHLLAACALTGRLGKQPAATLEHVLTHRKLVLELWRVDGARGQATERRRAWAYGSSHLRGTSALTRKALGLVLEGPV